MPPLAAAALVSLGVSASVASVAANVGFAVLSIGLSLLFAPKIEKPENIGRIPFRQSVPNRTRIIGKRRTAGSFLLHHAHPSGIFFGISALCEGEVKEFTRFYLHDDVVALQEDGHTITYPPGGGRYGDDKVSVYTKVGLPTETAFSEAVTALSPLWTNDHRGDGIAQALLVCADAGLDDQAKRYPFGLPVLSVELIATKVLDPRDLDQEWDDPSTWSFDGNDNPILQAVWLLTAPIEEGGMGLSFEECILPVIDKIAEQADVCDEPVALKEGGTEKRYICGSQYLLSDARTEALNAILGTCDGFCAENDDGTYTIKAGKWDSEDFEVVIEDRHVISYKVTDGVPDEDALTGVIVKYNSLPHEHTTVDAPVWPRDAYQGGDDRRVRTIEVTFCPSGTQAQRLSKRVAIYEMAQLRGTLVLNMYGVLLRNRRGATLQITDDARLADVKIKITRCEYNLLAGTCEVDFVVFDPVECDAWNAATEEGPLQPVIDLGDGGGFTTPTSLNAVASEIDGNIFVEISFNPGSIASNNTNYRYRYRIADAGGGLPGNWITGTVNGRDVERQSATQWIVTISSVPEAELEFQLQAYQHDRSEWSATATVDTSDPGPARVQNLAATNDGRDVDLTWDSPDSANFDHAKVYRVVVGGGFPLSDLIAEVSGSPDSPMSYTDTVPGGGTWDYYITAETSADVASLPTGPETVTTPTGAAYLAGVRTDVVAIDYLDQTMIELDAGTPANDYTGGPTGRLAFTRAGAKYIFDANKILQSIAVDVPGYDHHPATGAPRGLLLELGSTNRLASGSSRDLTNAAWTKINCTAAKNVVGLDGVSNSASRLTATGANATCNQTVTAASANGIVEFWMKRITGSGAVSIARDGTTYTDISGQLSTSDWTRVYVRQNSITNPVVSIKLATSGDEVAVDYANENIQMAPGSPNEGTRAVDTLVFSSNFPSWLASPTALTVAFEFEALGVSSTVSVNLIAISDNTVSKVIARGRITATNTLMDTVDTTAQDTINHALIASETVYRLNKSIAANDFRSCLNGSLGTPDTSGTVPTGMTRIYFGASGSGSSRNSLYLRRLLIFPATSTDTELQNLLL